MKKLLTLSLFLLAFMTNAIAQEEQETQKGWIKDPAIRETHWFGQYEYLDQSPVDFLSRTINWSGNYLESIVIVKNWTNQNPAQAPKTSYYSWLDHQLRFSVDNTGAWSIAGSNNSAYSAASQGQGLKNNTWQNQNFHIHNLKAGDEYTVTYYENNGGQATIAHDNNVVGTATVSIPGQAIIRCVEIKLAEYVASDFKVEEVKGDYVTNLTSSHDRFLENNNVSGDDDRRKFGDLGYRYTFKGPGVLEDKRGAVPYITMKFGNDNDMTFVRALAGSTVQFGDLTKTEATFYAKENAGDPVEASPNSDGEFVVHSSANAQADWDAQFWIAAPYALTPGQTFQVKFEYKASQDARVETQSHLEPGNYVVHGTLGDLNFTTEWQEYTGEVMTVSDATNQAGQSGMQSIAFNLNVDRNNNTYYFKNIKLYVPERTEVISTDDLGAASIIHEDNDLNPDHEHLQYRWTFKDSNFGNRFSEDEIRDRLVGKEWSTFTAHHATNASSGVNPSSNNDWPNGVNYVYGDEFSTIWPLCGNFFYFFPEVDGLLEIDYYCEGSNETNAFWYKQDPEGNQMKVSDQPMVQFINANGQDIGNRTDGSDNYKMMVQVKKGGIYYLCSLPTNISHERPIFRLKSYTFIPRFRVTPLYKVVNNTTDIHKTANDATGYIDKVAEIIGGPYTDLNGGDTDYGNNDYELTGTFTRNAEPEARVKCLGNVVSAKAKVVYNGGKQYLSFYDIKFREGSNGENYNPGGAIVAHVNNKVGQASFVLTIAYDAAEAKWGKDADGNDVRVAATPGGKEVKHWDFYSGKGDYITKRNGTVSYNGDNTYTTEVNSGWDLGKYGTDDGTRYATNQNTWLGKSKLFKETHKADGLTADWQYDWVDVPNRIEPLFKSIYDMEADNADMIHETAGLVFFTEPNELGIYNESDLPTESYQDRFIGLMGGGKLIIPRLKANDRVVIKMGCFGNCDDNSSTSEMEQKAVLKLTNAKDVSTDATGKATGKLINGDYIIGGSESYENETAKAKTLPHGEYHFIVNETSNSDDKDFSIELKKGALLKIYSIDIYRNAANSNADILTENKVTGLEPEMLFTDQDTEGKDMVCYLRYSGYQEKSEFNSLDQVRGNLGTLSTSSFQGKENTSQPYWKYTAKSIFKKGDFGSFRAKMAVKTKDDANTYVTDYAPGTLAVGYLETMPYPYTWDFTDLIPLGDADDAIDEEKGNTNLLDDFNGWKVVNDQTETTGMRNAPETEPGVLFANGGQLYASDQMFIESAGIGLKRSMEDPDDAKLLNNSVNITSDGLVLNSANAFHKLVLPKVSANAVIYVRATPLEGAQAQYSTNGEDATDFTALSAYDNENDVIYAMKNSAEQNVELWLNKMTVKKIGVSMDKKTLDQNGWATESRGRVIDPALTSYLTGRNIKTYFVSAVNLSAAGQGGTVILTEANTNEEGQVLCALEDGDQGACILHNAETGEQSGRITIIDGGFHLFVPDLHDYKVNDNGTITGLKTSTAKAAFGGEGSPTSLLRAQVTAADIDGTFMYEGTEYTNYILSYVHSENGQTKTEDFDAFYRMDPSGVHSNGNNGYMSFKTSDVKPGGASAAFAIVFDGDQNGIKEVNVNKTDEDEFYTINGQKLNSMPTTRGIYIVNGKKIVIK